MILASLLILAAADDTFLLRGATVHPVTSAAVENAAVLVRDGKIVSITTGKTAAPKGVRLVEAKGLHVWPGMINCATQMGINEVSSVRDVNDTNEIGDFVPQVRAIVAVNAGSDHIPVARVNGITSVLTLPASLGGGSGRGAGGSAIIRGQAALLRMDGWTWEEMEINRSAGMVLRWPLITTRGFTLLEGATSIPYSEAKAAYDDEKRKITEFFELARRYQRAKSQPGPSFKPDVVFDAMLPVLDGKVPLLVAAERERTIREVVAFADQQKVRVILFDVKKPGAMLKTLAEKKIPVIVAKTTEAPLDEDDAYDAPFTLPNELRQDGVKFAFATYDNQFARNLPYEAAYAVAYGLPHDDAMKALTIHAAEIFGAAAQTGSLEAGKWADFIVTDGDPLEVRTQVKMLFIQGRNVTLETKHTRLYEKYMSRP